MHSNPDIYIRPAVFTDAYAMSLIAAHLPHTNTWLRCYNLFMPSTDTRCYAQRIQTHLLNPRSLSFAAVLASAPEEMVGYALCSRLGNDDKALAYINSTSTLYFMFFGWIWGLWLRFVSWVLREGREDVEAESWSPHCERWYVKSVVVRQGWRRKGIGTQLMGMVLNKAAAEGVPVTLEATERGEKLYTKLGFEVIERLEVGDGEEGGALMLWCCAEAGQG